MNSVHLDLIAKLHGGVNPYGDFPKDKWYLDPFTFGEQPKWFEEAIRSPGLKVVVEVGTFLGHGARHMGAIMKTLPQPSALIAVDDFLSDEVLWADHRERLRFRNGRPEFYWTWMSNTIEAGLQDVIIPLPMSSVSASRHLKKHGVLAQLIYIDACHHEGDVLRDLNAYWDDVLDRGGVMIIDDYAGGPNDPMFGGLVRDVDRFKAARKLRAEIDGNKVRIRKP